MRPLARESVWHIVMPVEVNTVDGAGDKPLFPLGVTVLMCPKFVWFQVCQLLLSEGFVVR